MPLVPVYTPTTFTDGVTPINSANQTPPETALAAHATAINALDVRVVAEEAQPDIPAVVNGQWIKGVGGAAVWTAITQADVSGLSAALTARELTANRAAANGYAPLGADSKVPAANLPTSASLEWIGNWSAATPYKEGDVVILNERSYMALRPSTNETPLPWSTPSAGGAVVDSPFLGMNGGDAQGANGVANDAILLPFSMAGAWAIDVVHLNCGSASGNLDVGVYDAAGVRLGSSGSIVAVIGQRTLPFTARVSGGAGDFWLAVAYSSTAVRMYGSFGPFVSMCRKVAASFPLPANIAIGTTPPNFATSLVAPLV